MSATLIKFLEELKEYTDENGQVLPEKDVPGFPQTGNGNLYTSIAHHVASRIQDGNPFKLQFSEVIAKSSAGYGLYHRAPRKNKDMNARDDYIWIAFAAKKLNYYHITLPIMQHGLRYNWVYNNLKPGSASILQNWFGRFPWVVTHFYWCAGCTPPMWRRFLWSVYLSYLGWRKRKGSTSWMLSYAMVNAASKLQLKFFEKWAIDKWTKGLNKTYSHGFKGALAEHLGAEHPIVKYW